MTFSLFFFIKLAVLSHGILVHAVSLKTINTNWRSILTSLPMRTKGTKKTKSQSVRARWKKASFNDKKITKIWYWSCNVCSITWGNPLLNLNCTSIKPFKNNPKWNDNRFVENQFLSFSNYVTKLNALDTKPSAERQNVYNSFKILNKSCVR